MSFLVDPLSNPDGSCTCTLYGYKVLGSVNGPIEVSRRDEQPEKAAIEVNIRTATGIGSPRDRYLESIIQVVMQDMLRTEQFPRTLIQLTLQILGAPDESEVDKLLGPGMEDTTYRILPTLLSCSILTFLSASFPFRTLAIPIVLLTRRNPTPSLETSQTFLLPPPSSIKKGPNSTLSLSQIIKLLPRDQGARPLITSFHVFLVSVPDGSKMLGGWSEGEFSEEEWTDAWETSVETVRGDVEDAMELDDSDDEEGGVSLDGTPAGQKKDSSEKGLEVIGKWLAALRKQST